MTVVCFDAILLQYFENLDTHAPFPNQDQIFEIINVSRCFDGKFIQIQFNNQFIVYK